MSILGLWTSLSIPSGFILTGTALVSMLSRVPDDVLYVYRALR